MTGTTVPMPHLITASMRVHRSFLTAMAEFQAGGRGGPPRRGGRVPQTTLWWVSGDEYLGRISIRHRLTAHLREIGGHIDYDIRPSARQLSGTLPQCSLPRCP